MAYPRLAARVRLTAASRPPMRMCPCRAAPHRIELLHERPSPSSDWTARQPHARWVARMTKRPASTGAGKSASEPEARPSGVAMSDEIRLIDESCKSYAARRPCRDGCGVGW